MQCVIGCDETGYMVQTVWLGTVYTCVVPEYWRGWVAKQCCTEEGGRGAERGEGPGPAGALLLGSTRKGGSRPAPLINPPLPPTRASPNRPLPSLSRQTCSHASDSVLQLDV